MKRNYCLVAILGFCIVLSGFSVYLVKKTMQEFSPLALANIEALAGDEGEEGGEEEVRYQVVQKEVTKIYRDEKGNEIQRETYSVTCCNEVLSGLLECSYGLCSERVD